MSATPNLDPRPAGVSRAWRTTALGLMAGVAAYATFGWWQARAELDRIPLVREVVPPPRDARVDRTLGAVDFDEVPLPDAVQALGRQADLNVLARWQAASSTGSGTKPVTLHLRHVTFATAMDALLGPASGTPGPLGWAERGGVVTVAEQDRLDHDPASIIVRAYDVRALIDQMPPPPIPTPAQLQAVLGRAATVGYDDRADEVIRAVELAIDPNSWKDNGGSLGSTQMFAGQMIVTQTEHNQRAIEAFLQLLRSRGG